MPYKNPEDKRDNHRRYMKSRLASDPDFRAKHLRRVKANQEKYQEAARERIREFKAAGCILCGEQEVCCLVAHHMDPAGKEFNLSAATKMGFGKSRIEKELAKFVCLCMNCHAKVHAGLEVLAA